MSDETPMTCDEALRLLAVFIEPCLLNRDSSLIADGVEDSQFSILKLACCSTAELNDTEHVLLGVERDDDDGRDPFSSEAAHTL